MKKKKRDQNDGAFHAALQHYAFGVLFTGLATFEHFSEAASLSVVLLKAATSCAVAVLYVLTARLIVWRARGR